MIMYDAFGNFHEQWYHSQSGVTDEMQFTRVLTMIRMNMSLRGVLADPKHYTVEFENHRIRVIRIKYGPGEKSVMHTHGPSMAVYLTDSKVRMTLPDGTSFEATAKAGDIQWADAEEHLPQNIGDARTELVLVELKD